MTIFFTLTLLSCIALPAMWRFFQDAHRQTDATPFPPWTLMAVLILAGLVWLLPWAGLPAVAQKRALTAAALFVTLLAAGVFYIFKNAE